MGHFRDFVIAVLLVLLVLTSKTIADLDRRHMQAEQGLMARIEKLEQEDPAPEGVLVSLGMFTVTAYCDCGQCQEQWIGQTSTGADPIPQRTVAVDPKVINYGTELIIDGHRYVAEDSGGSIKGHHIDILMSTHEEAEAYGVQEKEVFTWIK